MDLRVNRMLVITIGTLTPHDKPLDCSFTPDTNVCAAGVALGRPETARPAPKRSGRVLGRSNRPRPTGLRRQPTQRQAVRMQNQLSTVQAGEGLDQRELQGTCPGRAKA